MFGKAQKTAIDPHPSNPSHPPSPGTIVNVNDATVLFCFPFYVGTRKCTFKEKEWCEEKRTKDSWKKVHNYANEL